MHSVQSRRRAGVGPAMDMGEAQMGRQRYWPIPPAVYQEVNEMIKQMQENVIIQPCW